MSPLEFEGNRLEDDERYTVSWWAKLLSISVSTVDNVVRRGGIEIHWTTSPKNLPQREIPVRSFPQLVENFKKSRESREGKPYHPWAQVDTETDSFKVTPPSGKTIIFLSK